VKEIEIIGMEFNIKKSGCLRIGVRHEKKVEAICMYNKTLPWVQELKFLGIVILSAKKFKFNFQTCKQKFYRALNGIFGKIGVDTSPVVLCSLIQSFCVPLLLYAAEALSWNKKSLASLENAYSQAFYKIFKTFDKMIAIQCQYFLGYLPMKFLLDVRKLNYLANIRRCNHSIRHLSKWLDSDFSDLCQSYDVPVVNRKLRIPNHKVFVWGHFEDMLTREGIL
jgi:hypothetical protein